MLADIEARPAVFYPIFLLIVEQMWDAFSTLVVVGLAIVKLFEAMSRQNDDLDPKQLPEKAVKRRLQDCDAALASDDLWPSLSRRSSAPSPKERKTRS